MVGLKSMKIIWWVFQPCLNTNGNLQKIAFNQPEPRDGQVKMETRPTFEGTMVSTTKYDTDHLVANYPRIVSG